MAQHRLFKSRFAAFQYRDFQLLWIGQLLSATGSQMQVIAVNWHVYSLLQDETVTLNLFGAERTLAAGALGLGMLGLVRILPIFLFSLWGGMLADTHDRRKIMIGTQISAAIFAAVLAILTLSGGVTVGWVYFLTAAIAGTVAIDDPARQSLVPNLVARKHVPNAVSLNTLMWYGATISGPAIAGVMLTRFDVGWVYTVNALSFTAGIFTMIAMQYRGQAASKEGMDWAALREGILFTYREKMIWSTMLLDFFATFFASARMMLPIIATEVLGLGVGGYGFLATAQPVGAVLAGVTLAWRKDIYRQGVVLLVSVAIYGAATALFGLATSLAVAYLLFALTGAGDTVSTVIRGTIRQLTTPDELRGRMTGVNMIFFSGGPQLGELEAGLVAAALGVQFAVVSGGIATVLLTGLIAWQYPKLRRFTSDDFDRVRASLVGAPGD